jgi:hypothetical protein
MKKALASLVVASAFTALPLAAGAATFLGSSVTDGASSVNLSNSGVDATFTAYSNAATNAAGTFDQKAIAGFTAVGVAGGRTDGELDINGQGVSEKITVDFTSAAQGIAAIEIAFLYDGPEFGDFNEVAVITASNGLIGKLIATYSNAAGLTAFWDVIGDANPAVAVGNISPAVDPNGAAVWRIVNPFGVASLTSLAFTAENGVCGIPTCTNQSDYSLYKIETALGTTEIPEPSTYLMMLAGLGMLGFMVKRRTNG